jgi:hypothetical protein
VDGTGNVIIADYLNDRVVKVSPGGIQSTVAAGLNLPTSVAVDAANNIFIADTFNDRVLEASGDGRGQTTVGSGLIRPGRVAVDWAGNILIADTRNNRVVEVQRGLPPAFSFSRTVVGKTSASQMVTIRNVGNQPLHALTPGLVIGVNFEQSATSGTPADCAPNFFLPPGANCSFEYCLCSAKRRRHSKHSGADGRRAECRCRHAGH